MLGISGNGNFAFSSKVKKYRTRKLVESGRLFVPIVNLSLESTKIPWCTPRLHFRAPPIWFHPSTSSDITNNKISYQNYSNNSHLYSTLSPGDIEPIQGLCRCLVQTKARMCHNIFQLSKNKTETILLFRPKEQRLRMITQLQQLVAYNQSGLKSVPSRSRETHPCV